MTIFAPNDHNNHTAQQTADIHTEILFNLCRPNSNLINNNYVKYFGNLIFLTTKNKQTGSMIIIVFLIGVKREAVITLVAVYDFINWFSLKTTNAFFQSLFFQTNFTLSEQCSLVQLFDRILTFIFLL